jgi:hypothetical protein
VKLNPQLRHRRVTVTDHLLKWPSHNYTRCLRAAVFGNTQFGPPSSHFSSRGFCGNILGDGDFTDTEVRLFMRL